MLDNLSGFKSRCCYCFMGLRDGLSRCTCGLSLCGAHRRMHLDKFGCSESFSIEMNEDGELLVEILSPSEGDTASREVVSPAFLAQRIKSIVKENRPELDDDRVECPHILEITPVETSLERPKCSNCGLEENLWMCLKCGNVGCGREQPSKKGSSHALAHFQSHSDESVGHAQAVYISSLGEDVLPDTYCYKCDAFVCNPHCLWIEYENPNIQGFADGGERRVSGEGSGPVFREDAHFIGIRNAGQTCYISSVLQILGNLYRNCGVLDSHFEVCDTNPLECLCCQFARVMIALSRQRCFESLAIPACLDFLDISDFLRITFREMPQYVRGEQQDSSEFLQNLLLRISFYESAGLLPPVTDNLKFTVETVVQCTNCGYSSNNRTEDKILYMSYGGSLKDVISAYFAKTELPCRCGQSLTVQNVLIGPPGNLIISIKRYKVENGELTKIADPIRADRIFLGPGAETKLEFAVENCIVHTGSSLHCGHYTWWTRFGGQCLLLNDRNVEASTEEASQDGVIFMFK